MKRFIIISLISIFVFMLFLAGCGANTTPIPETGEQQPADELQEDPVKEPADKISLSDYFPLTKGSSWKYLGDGNEYASFNRKVVFVEGNKAQIIEDNGGTVSASVYTFSEDEITRIFFQGEEYQETNFLNEEPNENLIVLKKPISVGTKWEVENGTREIVDVNATVDTPIGEFTNCIKVEISNEHSTLHEYFKDGIGMVKRVFISEGVEITSTLQEVNIAID
ncbi:MAG: hypothetical protein KGZ33_04740 [Alkaliphilus sp.]|nr:hypothetical protein [Alkaliphilus sp.]